MLAHMHAMLYGSGISHLRRFWYILARMAWVIVGLGNPGEEYSSTRHNAGRMALERFAKDSALSEWKEDKKKKYTLARGMCGKEIVVAVLPDTYMNKSGSAVAPFVKSVKAAERLVVAYDDMDLPLGVVKLSFDRGSGGHKGLESVMRAVKTKKFTRVRIGVSPSTASRKIKKPQGEKDVLKFILAKFKPSEVAELKPVMKRASEALAAIIERGHLEAMNEFNRG
jgi:PTH1 family peptidyl-tRNA hydrolase